MTQPDEAPRKSTMNDIWEAVAERGAEAKEVAEAADSFYEEHPAILERIHELTAQKRTFDQRDPEALKKWLQKAHPVVMWTFAQIHLIDQQSSIDVTECALMVRATMMVGYYQAIRDLMDEEIIV